MRKTSGRSWLWSWLLLVLLPLAAQGQTVSMEAGTDRMGSDYKGFPLAGTDPGECRKACAADAACKAFTWVRPGVKGPQAMCYLKSAVPPSTPDDCCTSGVRSAGGRPGPPPPPEPSDDPDVSFVIPAPTAAAASEELAEQEVTWKWAAIGCFPGGPGTTPKPCPFVKDIEGFRVYALDTGALRQTLNDPAIRFASLGKQTNKCYVVTAFKGVLESAPSPVACVDAPKPPLYQTSSAIATPVNLRATKDASVCAAATGGLFMGPICDALIKSNAQILLWDYSSSAIDGFRLYDAVKGEPFPVETSANKKTRMFAVKPAVIVVSDFCFSVRAYKGDTESPSSNPVCLTPQGPAPAPVKPMVVIAAASGIQAGGLQVLKNQNTGCPFAQKFIELRHKSALAATMSVYWIHSDKNILCGHRTVVWNEGSISFPLDQIPSDFKSAELRFTANDSVAKEGTEGGFLGKFGNKPSFGVNCIQSIHAFDITLKNNAALASDQLGDPAAYFSWIKQDLITTETQAKTTHRFDVTGLLKKRMAAGKKTVGFVWEVDKNMVGDNDVCFTSYQDFALEVKPKQ